MLQAFREPAHYQLLTTDKHPWTGQGIDVAVIDSGIDFTHVKLGGPGSTAAYAQAYCGNPAAPADPSLFGPDAPKVKGGYDWVGELWPTYSASIQPDPNPIDFEGHGTHVADIIGGLPSASGAGDQGVAPGVNIWGFKACSAVATSCNGLSPRSYNLSSAFRYADDAVRGASVTVSPSSVTVPARYVGLVDVTVAINAGGLRDWTLDAGVFGASGTNIYCDMMPPSSVNPRTGCPTLTMFEYDGYITIDGGPNNTVRMPWQILPKQTAATSIAATNPASVKFANASPYKATLGDAFALVEVSPNNCEITDGNGNCVEENYEPGILPGINQTAIDIAAVGVRGYTVPDISKAAQVIVSPSNLINDDVVDFAVTVYDKPFRASHNYPVEFDIYVDSDSNGVDDYVVFNADLTLNAADGRNAVFVADINPANGTRPTRPYFYSNTNINSQNWILPVPAAIDVTANKPFKFYALAFDAYFTGSLWDCSPFDCSSYHSYQVGKPKYRPTPWSFRVPVAGSYTLPYLKPAGGAAASPSQDGLLFLYRDAPVGRESDLVLLP